MDPENETIAAEQNAANKRAVAKAARERRKQNPDREVKVDARLRNKVKGAIPTWRAVLSAYAFDFVSSAVYLDDRVSHVRASAELAHVTGYWETGRDRRFVSFTIAGDGVQAVRGGVDRAMGRAREEFQQGERLETTVSDDRSLASVLRQIAALATEGPDGLPPPDRVVEIASRTEALDMMGTIMTSGRPCGCYGETALVAARRAGIQVQRVTCDGAWAVGVLDGDRMGVYVGTNGIPWRACFGRVGE